MAVSPFADRFDESLRFGAQWRHLDRSQRGGRRSCGVVGSVGDAAVAEGSDGDLVAVPERERTQHRIGAGGDVVDEHQIVGRTADECCDVCHGGPDPGRPAGAGPVGQLTQEESRRIALDLFDQLALEVEHPPRGSADRPVVEIGDRRVEHPVQAQTGAESFGRRHRPNCTQLIAQNGIPIELVIY